MKLLLVLFCLTCAIYAVTSQPVTATDQQPPAPDDGVTSNNPWNWGAGPWGPGPWGCPCMNGYGPGPGWGGPRGMRGGWGMGLRGRGWGWRRGFGMGGPGWGPGAWYGAGPTGTNPGQDPLTPDNPVMPWFLYDLTPEQRTRFWEEIGDDLPPPMTYERRIRVLEALRKATGSS